MCLGEMDTFIVFQHLDSIRENNSALNVFGCIHTETFGK